MRDRLCQAGGPTRRELEKGSEYRKDRMKFIYHDNPYRTRLEKITKAEWPPAALPRPRRERRGLTTAGIFPTESAKSRFRAKPPASQRGFQIYDIVVYDPQTPPPKVLRPPPRASEGTEACEKSSSSNF